MAERMRIGRAVIGSSFLLMVCTTVSAQTGNVGERPNDNRPFDAITDDARLRIPPDLWAETRVRTDLHGWHWGSGKRNGQRSSVVNGTRAQVSKGRSRKKAVLIGAAIGGGVGAGGGAYAVYATGGDAEPWVVPAFAGIGAALGAVCGFLISLF